MDNPGRLPTIVLSMALFMTAAVMFGEGNKQLQQEKAQQVKNQPAQPGAEVPDLH